MERLLMPLLALAALVAAIILMVDNRVADAQVTAVLFVGLVLAIGRAPRT